MTLIAIGFGAEEETPSLALITKALLTVPPLVLGLYVKISPFFRVVVPGTTGLPLTVKIPPFTASIFIEVISPSTSVAVARFSNVIVTG